MTVAQRLAAFPRGAQEIAAARLARTVATCLERAVEARGVSQRALAAELGVTEGAVSQVLRGDGNVRVATAARYLRALGYEADVTLRPVDADAPPVAVAPSRRSRKRDPEPPVPALADEAWTVLRPVQVRHSQPPAGVLLFLDAGVTRLETTVLGSIGGPFMSSPNTRAALEERQGDLVTVRA